MEPVELAHASHVFMFEEVSIQLRISFAVRKDIFIVVFLDEDKPR